MEARKLQRKAKSLLTDLAADRDSEENIERYKSLTAAAFSSYAGIKLSMNLFTLCEMEQERRMESLFDPEDTEDGKTDPAGDFQLVLTSVRNACSDEPSKGIEDTLDLRDRITARMKVLTSFTDFFEQHEYILNRKEAGVLGTVEKVSPGKLAEEAFAYVFSDQDKVVVNTRIQSVVEQLPVRITKQRFYDILSGAIELYKGGELQSAKDFIQSIREAALLTLPEGFDTMYPQLKQGRDLFDCVTYKDLDAQEYQHLDAELNEMTRELEHLATRDLLVQEIVNDILILQLTRPLVSTEEAEEIMDDRFTDAERLLGKMTAFDLEIETFSSADYDDDFGKLEGAQEAAYETLLILEGSMADYAPEMDAEAAEALRKADLLTSTSLFMDLDNDPEQELEQELELELEKEQEKTGIRVVEDKAEESEIEALKASLFKDFDAVFEKLSKEEKRSRMAKVLSMVPVFFNSRDEIKAYFLYALENCRDDSELTAVSNILREMMAPMG